MILVSLGILKGGRTAPQMGIAIVPPLVCYVALCILKLQIYRSGGAQRKTNVSDVIFDFKQPELSQFSISGAQSYIHSMRNGILRRYGTTQNYFVTIMKLSVTS